MLNSTNLCEFNFSCKGKRMQIPMSLRLRKLSIVMFTCLARSNTQASTSNDVTACSTDYLARAAWRSCHTYLLDPVGLQRGSIPYPIHTTIEIIFTLMKGTWAVSRRNLVLEGWSWERMCSSSFWGSDSETLM